MIETQKQKILRMLREAPDRTVSCRTFADHFLFHKLASRCSDLRKEGYDVRYIPGPTVMEGKYTLVRDREYDAKPQFHEESNGQFSFA